MTVMSFDTETSGLDVRKDQILQFGGILADEGSLEEKSRINLRVRRLPYVDPSDEALAVTNQDRRELDGADRLHEFEAAGEIARALGTVRGLISWNGPKYDVEIIRTTLFRNLHDPFLTSSHWHLDMLPVARALHAAGLGGIVIPTDAEGNAVFRLDKIAPANGIEIDAHDACGDSSGALALARLVRDLHPKLWATARQWSQPQTSVARLTRDLQDRATVFALHTKNRAPEIEPGIILGTHQKKFLIALQSGWGEIDGDLSGEKIHELLQSGRIISVRGNACAPVFRSTELSDIGLDAVDLVTMPRPQWRVEGSEILDAYRRWGEGASKFLKNKNDEESEAYEIQGISEKSSESRIYDGFPDATAKIRRDRFRSGVALEDRLACLPIGDDRLDEFCSRLLLEWGCDADRVRSRYPAGKVAAFDRALALMDVAEQFDPIVEAPAAGSQMSFGF